MTPWKLSLSANVYNGLVSALAHVCVRTLHCKVSQGHVAASPSSPAPCSQTEPAKQNSHAGWGRRKRGDDGERLLLHGPAGKVSRPRLCNLPPSACQWSSNLPLPVCYKYIQPLLIASNRRATRTPNYD